MHVDDRHPRDTFLRAYRDDLARGTPRSEAEYRALFPGHEDEISAEWALLQDGPMELAYDLAAVEHACDAAAGGTTEVANAGETIGPYRIRHELGRGGQAVVYLAEHTTFTRRVALKVLGRDAFPVHTATDRARFRREAEATARLDHPHLCSAFEAGESGDQAWIAMRYVPGETLARHIERAQHAGGRGPVPLPEGAPEHDAIAAVVGFFEKVARALHFAHERGLVHRDLKPGNLMVGEAGEPCVLDFGLAGDGLAGALTLRGGIVGTPFYLAPEQLADGAPRPDRRTDVYALGVTLYECLALRRPFAGSSRQALFHAILAGGGDDLRRRAASIPCDLALVVQTAMERDPERRYATAQELADDLWRVRNRQPIRARPLPRLLRLRRWLQRNPVAATVLVALVVLLGLGGWLLARAESFLRTASAGNRIAAAEAALGRDVVAALALAVEAHQLDPGLATVSQLHRVVTEPFPSLRLQMPKDVYPWWWRVRVAAGGRFAARFYGGDGAPSQSRGAFRDQDVIATWEADGSVAGTVSGPVGQIVGYAPSRRLDHVAVRWASGDVTFHDVTGQRLATVSVGPCRFVQVQKQQDHVWLVRDDGTMATWSWRGEALRELPRAAAKVDSIHVTDDAGRVLFGCSDGTLELRDASGEVLARVHVPVAPARDAASLARRAACAVVRSEAGEVWLVATDVSREPRGIPVAAACIAARLAPDGRRLLTLYESGMAQLWDVAGEPRVLAELVSSRSEPRPFEGTFLSEWLDKAFADSGERLFLIHDDWSVVLWDGEGRHVHTVPGRPGWNLMPVQFVGEELLVAHGPAVRRFDRDGRLVQTFAAGGVISSLALLPDGSGIVVLGFEVGAVFPFVDRELPQHRHGSQPLWAMAVAADGSVATGSADGTCQCRRKDGSTVALTRHDAGVMAAAFSPNGLLATGDMQGRVIVHDLQAATHFVLDHAELGMAQRRVLDLDFDPTGKPQLLSAWALGGQSGFVVLWDLTQRRVVRTFPVGGFTQAVHFASHGKSFVAANHSEHVQVWGLDGTGPRTLATHFTADVQWFPDGKRVLVGSSPVAVWDPATATSAVWSPDHGQAPWSMRFSPDGKFVVTADQDGTARLFTVAGQLLANCRTDGGPVLCAEFTPDGRRLVTSHHDGAVRTWFVDTDGLLACARSRLARGGDR